MWEEGPYKTFEKASESYSRRTQIMQTIRKPAGLQESRIKIGEGKWIAKDTTSSFEEIQREWMSKESYTPYMFIGSDHASKPYPSLIQYHWDEKFSSVSQETSEEVLAMNRKSGASLFAGVFYRDNGWVFHVKCEPYVFMSNPYDSMFIAWIERELFLIQAGLESMSDIRRSATKERENMEQLYKSLDKPKIDTDIIEIFAKLYDTKDPRVQLTSSF